MKKRPTGITILAIYAWLFALGHIVSSVLILALDSSLVAIAIILWAPALLSLVVGWGLWALHSWARKLCIYWAVWGLLYFPIGTILSAFIIWYLFQPYVVAAFEGWQPAGYGVGGPGVSPGVGHGQSPAYGTGDPGVAPVAASVSRASSPEPVAYQPAHPPRPKVNAWLIDLGSGHNHQLFQGDTRIGRGPNNDIKLQDRSVSREHILVREQGGHYTVYDRASHSGTLVNEQRLAGPVTLAHGDVIWLGDTQLQFVSS